MKRKISIFLILGLLFFFLFVIIPQCYERVDAGHVGIRVNLYGTQKGVDDVVEVTGAVWYNPITTEIYEFPLFIQNIAFTRDRTEGSPNNDEIRVSTKGGLVITMDVSVNYRIAENKAAQIFKKYRKPLAEISQTIIRNYLRDSYNKSAANFSAEEVYLKRNLFIASADSMFTKELGDEGFIIEKVVLLNELRLPDKIKVAIDRKIEAKQIAEQKKNELEQASADANKIIAKARGDSAALVIQAKAERIANEQRQQSLTPLLIQQQFIEKWDGKLPVYSDVPKIFKGIN